MLGAAARFSRVRSRSVFTSVADKGWALTPLANEASRNRRRVLRTFQFEMLLWQFGSYRHRCRQSEKDGCRQTPEQPNGAGNAQLAQGRIMRPAERTESGDRGQTGESNGFDHTSKIARHFVAALPD